MPVGTESAGMVLAHGYLRELALWRLDRLHQEWVDPNPVPTDERAILADGACMGSNVIRSGPTKERK
jgi:hypothetical protein